MKTTTTRKILAGLNYSGLDRLYQQLDAELGVLLTFHHVHPRLPQAFSPNAHLAVDPEFLSEIIRVLRQRGFELVCMDEVRARIQSPERKNRFAAITFDDGYRDNLEHAIPLLREQRVPYAMYIASGMIEGTANVWWEGIEALVRENTSLVFDMSGQEVELDCSNLAAKQSSFVKLMDYLTEELPENLQRSFVNTLCSQYEVDLEAHRERQLMTWDEIRQLAADPLCTIGAHTVDHPALARLTEDDASSEMVNGADVLAAKLGRKPDHFAYPYGYHQAAGPREFDLARKAGFKTAVTTRPGMVFAEHANYLTGLPRISANGLYQEKRYFAPLTSGLPTRLRSRMRRLDVA